MNKSVLEKTAENLISELLKLVFFGVKNQELILQIMIEKAHQLAGIRCETILELIELLSNYLQSKDKNNMHWLGIVRTKPNEPQLDYFVLDSRAQAIQTLIEIFQLDADQRLKLHKNGYLTISSKQFIEITSCDCTNNKHEGEL